MAGTRSRNGLPQGAGFVSIKTGCNLVHLLKRLHAGFSRLGAQRLFFEI